MWPQALAASNYAAGGNSNYSRKQTHLLVDAGGEQTKVTLAHILKAGMTISPKMKYLASFQYYIILPRDGMPRGDDSSTDY